MDTDRNLRRAFRRARGVPHRRAAAVPRAAHLRLLAPLLLDHAFVLGAGDLAPRGAIVVVALGSRRRVVRRVELGISRGLLASSCFTASMMSSMDRPASPALAPDPKRRRAISGPDKEPPGAHPSRTAHAGGRRGPRGRAGAIGAAALRTLHEGAGRTARICVSGIAM